MDSILTDKVMTKLWTWNFEYKWDGYASVIGICNTEMLDFKSSILAVDVFVEEGVITEGEKRKIKTEENGLKEEGM